MYRAIVINLNTPTTLPYSVIDTASTFDNLTFNGSNTFLNANNSQQPSSSKINNLL